MGIYSEAHISYESIRALGALLCIKGFITQAELEATRETSREHRLVFSAFYPDFESDLTVQELREVMKARGLL